MNDTVVLKKYANRRLYETEKSAYVTLPEVAEIIRQGRQVRVLDAKTGEDVTAFILTQVVLEEARNQNTLLPAPILHLIIRYGDNLLGEFFESYLQQIIQVYLAQKAVFDRQFKQWIDGGIKLSAMVRQGLEDPEAYRSLFELNPFFRTPPAGEPEAAEKRKKNKE